MASAKVSTAIRKLAIKTVASNSAAQVSKDLRANNTTTSTTNQTTPSATVNPTSKQALAKEENFPTSPVSPTTFAKIPTSCPIAPEGWNDQMLANLLSAWDSGTHDLEMLKRRLDLAYGLTAGSYSVDFLWWVLVRHDRANARVDQSWDWDSDDDAEGGNEFQVLMLEAKKGPVEPIQFL